MVRTTRATSGLAFGLCLLVVAAMLLSSAPSWAEGAPAEGNQARAGGSRDPGPVGAWHGASTCLVKPSACHDEEALYRFSASDGARDRVVCSANKIVDGKDVNMGSSECAYDAKSRSLACPLPSGDSVHLEIHRNAMEGGMTLRDGTPWRRIELHLVESR